MKWGLMGWEKGFLNCNCKPRIHSRPDTNGQEWATTITFNIVLSCVEFMTSRNQRNGFACQICMFEERRLDVRAVVICPHHCLRLCTLSYPFVKLFKQDKSEVTDYSWMAPDHSMTCWEKAHSYYIPKGLFKQDCVAINWDNLKFQNARISSNLYSRKSSALGKVPCKRGGRRVKRKQPNVEEDMDDEDDEEIVLPSSSSEEEETVLGRFSGIEGIGEEFAEL